MAAGKKREREGEDTEEGAEAGARETEAKIPRSDDPAPPLQPKKEEGVGIDAGEEEDDEDRILLPTSTSRASVKQGKECPYLDTISRQVGQR